MLLAALTVTLSVMNPRNDTSRVLPLETVRNHFPSESEIVPFEEPVSEMLAPATGTLFSSSICPDTLIFSDCCCLETVWTVELSLLAEAESEKEDISAQRASILLRDRIVFRIGNCPISGKLGGSINVMN